MSSGFNFRLTNLQAAIGVAQFERIDDVVERKRAIASRYTDGPPPTSTDRAADRAPLGTERLLDVRDRLAGRPAARRSSRGRSTSRVETRPFFLGMHRQPALLSPRGLFRRDYPVADALADQGLYLPSGAGLRARAEGRGDRRCSPGPRVMQPVRRRLRRCIRRALRRQGLRGGVRPHRDALRRSGHVDVVESSNRVRHGPPRRHPGQRGDAVRASTCRPDAGELRRRRAADSGTESRAPPGGRSRPSGSGQVRRRAIDVRGPRLPGERTTTCGRRRRTAGAALRRAGCSIFDVWNGPAVEAIGPSARTKSVDGTARRSPGERPATLDAREPTRVPSAYEVEQFRSPGPRHANGCRGTPPDALLLSRRARPPGSTGLAASGRRVPRLRSGATSSTRNALERT